MVIFQALFWREVSENYIIWVIRTYHTGKCRYFTFCYLLIPSYFFLPPESNFWTRKQTKRNSECKRKPCAVGSNL